MKGPVAGYSHLPRREVLTVGLLVAGAACAGSEADRWVTDGYVATEVVDSDGASLGSVAFPVSCSEDAGTEMRLGLALLHNMTYEDAGAAFERAAAADAGCGLAHWGSAMTLVHPLWPDVPTPEQLARGPELLARARAAGLGTPREEAYVAALEAYFRDGAERTEPERLASFAEGWGEVTAAFPDDPEAALFATLARIAAVQGTRQAAETQSAAGTVAETVLAQIPDHPGAHHYVIHSFDLASLSDRALPVAMSYGSVAPENSHALHMTSHIFTREGLWEESIDYNRRAADVAWREPIGEQLSYHHLHAIDYLAYAYLQQGADEEADDVLDHVRSIEGPVYVHTASAYAFAAVPARVALERRQWDAAAALRPREPASIPWDDYPHLEAMPVFARALGAVHTGDLPAARLAASRLAELADAAENVPGAYGWGTQVEVQRLAAAAWIAYAEGNADEAVSVMEESAALEASTSKNPVTPAEVQPAGELLGDLYLELGRHADALEAYTRALERNRGRYRSLLGAGRAAEQLGDETAATDYYRRLVAMAGASITRRAEIERAASYGR